MIPIPPDVSVLNCGAGDMTFSFDPADPQECARAERVVKDMLRRGYILFAKVGEKYKRVKEFDEKNREYVIADGPGGDGPIVPEAIEQPEPTARPAATATAQAKKKLDKATKRIPARGTRVTGIAPTAGG